MIGLINSLTFAHTSPAWIVTDDFLSVFIHSVFVIARCGQIESKD